MISFYLQDQFISNFVFNASREELSTTPATNKEIFIQVDMEDTSSSVPLNFTGGGLDKLSRIEYDVVFSKVKTSP